MYLYKQTCKYYLLCLKKESFKSAGKITLVYYPMFVYIYHLKEFLLNTLLGSFGRVCVSLGFFEYHASLKYS